MSSAPRLRSIAEMLTSKDKEVLRAMSELQAETESEFANVLEQAREDICALKTVRDQTYKELDDVKKERDRAREESNEVLYLVGSADLRREKEMTKREEQAQFQLGNVKAELNKARSALEESSRELDAARKQIYEVKKECEQLKKQWDLARNEHETALNHQNASEVKVNQEHDNTWMELTSQSSRPSTDPLEVMISTSTSTTVRLPNPTVVSKQKNTRPHLPPSSHSSLTSTCRPSETQTGRDQSEDDCDQVWEWGRVFVPRECATFPGTLFARDVAYLFEHVEERDEASIRKRFATMVPGVKFVYATFRAHRYLWENALTTEREAAKNLPRQPHGLWKQWVQTCTVSKLKNKRTRENRQSNAQRGQIEQGSEEESGTEEGESLVADEHKAKEETRGLTATKSGSQRMKRYRTPSDDEEDELLSPSPRKKAAGTIGLCPRVTRSATAKK
ncbi:hypothetical protein C8R43DRAFT_965818 [Mycena crocata]|nr:hypothetical protein C8R43DRAFT_965818 [Mycena crocata]